MHDELTKVDIKKIQEEIDYRTTVLTPQLVEYLHQAAEQGDRSENEEYKYYKRETNRNYSRIAYLKKMIATAVIIEDKAGEDEIGLFDHVRLFYENKQTEKTITIVTTLRNDVTKGLISKESPVGKALLGHKAGDRVLIKVNDTLSYYVKVLEIEKGEDDESLEISRF